MTNIIQKRMIDINIANYRQCYVAKVEDRPVQFVWDINKVIPFYWVKRLSQKKCLDERSYQKSPHDLSEWDEIFRKLVKINFVFLILSIFNIGKNSFTHPTSVLQNSGHEINIEITLGLRNPTTLFYYSTLFFRWIKLMLQRIYSVHFRILYEMIWYKMYSSYYNYNSGYCMG